MRYVGLVFIEVVVVVTDFQRPLNDVERREKHEDHDCKLYKCKPFPNYAQVFIELHRHAILHCVCHLTRDENFLIRWTSPN